jgi:F-type H+/Na+-transporting ATPase subunit alpha
LMEIIKQGIHVPLPVVKQVAIIFAGTNGYLDDMPANKVGAFEEYLSVQIDSKYGDFVQLFNKNLAMTDDVKAALKKLLEEVKSTFKV